MRIVLQRVTRASVDVEGERIGEIDAGLLLLIGVAPGDELLDLGRVAQKIATLRIFQDEDGKMNRSVMDIEGSILAVSQFTLHADLRKGRRPSFINAAPPEVAEPLFDRLVTSLRNEGLKVATGRFGAKMEVELVNSGPVTIVYEVAPNPPNG